jgi:hypothetical protein
MQNCKINKFYKKAANDDQLKLLEAEQLSETTAARATAAAATSEPTDPSADNSRGKLS